MKIAIFGTTGWVGGAVLREALQRGHHVTAIVRDPAKLTFTDPKLTVIKGDATDGASVAATVKAHDGVIASIGSRNDGRHEIVVTAAKTMIAALPKAGVKRFIWVGGAGSLEVAPGKLLIDTPQFPPEYTAEAKVQVDTLKIFQSSGANIEWTFLSPAAILEPGKRTGAFRTGADQLLTDDKGESRISVDDLAVALVNETETPAHVRQRFTVAY